MIVSDNELRAGDGAPLGRFSSHWAAVAAMIRLGGNPGFRSIGGDKPEDLAIEAAIRAGSPA